MTMTPTIADRARSLLSHKHTFGHRAENTGYHLPERGTKPDVDRQYILRMMIRSPESNGLQIPEDLEWLRIAIFCCIGEQLRKDIANPFIYVTVRHGLVTSENDDVWHVDGFSMRTPHIPEQNYVFTSVNGTEVLNQEITLPEDFDPFTHNIHQYFQDCADESGNNVQVLAPGNIYCIDPYVVHRRPMIPAGTMRTFFRISFIPVEIEDDTCTANPLIPRDKPYNRDGVTSLRDKLKRYPVAS